VPGVRWCRAKEVRCRTVAGETVAGGLGPVRGREAPCCACAQH